MIGKISAMTMFAMVAALALGMTMAGCQGEGITIEVPDVTVETDDDSGGASTGGSGGQQPAATDSFAGVWDTTHGELRLHKVGSYIVGDYDDKGIMVGRPDGDCLAGVFTNGDKAGTFRFQMTTGDAFDGQWAWHGDSLSPEWDGTRTSDTPPDALSNFARSGLTRRSDDDRSLYDGTYSTTFGMVHLYSRNGFLIGDYDTKGIIAGMWDGDSFVGRFTNKPNQKTVGWFDLEFNRRTGQFEDGEWGWHAERADPTGWDFNRQAGATPRLDNMVDDVSCP